MRKFGGLGNLLPYSIAHLIPHHRLLPLGNTTRLYSKFPEKSFASLNNSSVLDLARRIWKVRRREVSIIPILENWAQEVGFFKFQHIYILINRLSCWERYFHALEISKWLAGKYQHSLSPTIAAVQLFLISKVHGIEQVEDYFNNIPTSLKDCQVYDALLRFYVDVTCVEKAEETMNTMKELGFGRTSTAYNSMLMLYCKTRNTEKVDALVQEMDRNGIKHNMFAYMSQLKAYSAVSNSEGMEKTLARMESDPNVVLDWTNYITVANLFEEVGLQDRAFEMLKKGEGLISKGNRNAAYYQLLMEGYIRLRKKAEFLRIWELHKGDEEVRKPMRGIRSIFFLLLEFDDWENAERVFEDLESCSQKLGYRMDFVSGIIGAYSRNGFLERIETLVNRIISNGMKSKPDSLTWYYLAIGYLKNGQPSEAEDAVKKTMIQGCTSWVPKYETLVASIKWLKVDGDTEKAEYFTKLLMDNSIICSSTGDHLLNDIKCCESSGDPEHGMVKL